MSDRPKSRDEAYLVLLSRGLVMLRESAFSGQIDLCQIEADHLHNVPTLVGAPDESRHEYYIECERGLYLERLRTLEATEYLEDAVMFYSESWEALAAAAGVQLSE